MNCSFFSDFALRSNRRYVCICICNRAGGLESENIRKELGGGRVWIPCYHVAIFHARDSIIVCSLRGYTNAQHLSSKYPQQTYSCRIYCNRE